MEMCRDCGQRPVCFGSDGLCTSCEIAHIEDQRFLEEAEAWIIAHLLARGLGLSGDVSWT